MNYLVIYAHPDPHSFNHAILETVIQELDRSENSYYLRDLYANSFDPVLKGTDLQNIRKNRHAEDLIKEQELVREADVLIFIFPVWWFSMPAILKGYIDRVFAEGFAFQLKKDGTSGLLRGKRAIIFNTTGGTRKNYEGSGFAEAFRKCICSGIFHFCGIDEVVQHFLYSVPAVSAKERAEMLQRVRQIMKDQILS
jgi:NAD(P)H dehydrogenase (quinone)